ncbi:MULTISPECIES: hypothetical protein [unclassified Mucilaginibacter]|uniref:hypothetical protein n=1 Tax=unclassified Mucilaginibacter TaxID=2617802 RepID=UPI0031F61F75
MYRKDHLLKEAQRMAQMIAKLLGLKNVAGKEDEFKQVFDDTLLSDFDIRTEELLALDLKDFDLWLKRNNFNAEKLDTLAQLLYMHAEPFKAETPVIAQLHKVLLVFELLEKEHHWQSFENIGKRQIIQQYLKQHNA